MNANLSTTERHGPIEFHIQFVIVVHIMTLKQGADLGDTVGNTSSVIGEFLQANCHWSRMKRVILSYSTCAMIVK